MNLKSKYHNEIIKEDDSSKYTIPKDIPPTKKGTKNRDLNSLIDDRNLLTPDGDKIEPLRQTKFKDHTNPLEEIKEAKNVEKEVKLKSPSPRFGKQSAQNVNVLRAELKGSGIFPTAPQPSIKSIPGNFKFDDSKEPHDVTNGDQTTTTKGRFIRIKRKRRKKNTTLISHVTNQSSERSMYEVPKKFTAQATKIKHKKKTSTIAGEPDF